MTRHSFPVALAAVLWFGAAQAADNKHYGVVCLRNDTRANITYRFRIGDGGWETGFLAPRNAWKFSHRYDSTNENKSPPILVRYDADATNRKFSQPKELTRRAAVGDTCQEAYLYTFQYERANRNFITLERVR